MEKRRPIPLTEAQVRSILSKPDWAIYDIPPGTWSGLPGFIDTKNTLSVLASGILNSTQSVSMHGLQDVIGGFDWIRIEENPMPAEPYLNAYHFVITRESDNTFNFHGPFKDEMPLPHWVYANDLDIYLSRLTSEGKQVRKSIVVLANKMHALDQVMNCYPANSMLEMDFLYFSSFSDFYKSQPKNIEAIFLDYFLDQDKKPGTEFVSGLTSRYFFGFSSRRETTNILAKAARETRNWSPKNIFAIQKIEEELDNKELRKILLKVFGE